MNEAMFTLVADVLLCVDSDPFLRVRPADKRSHLIFKKKHWCAQSFRVFPLSKAFESEKPRKMQTLCTKLHNLKPLLFTWLGHEISFDLFARLHQGSKQHVHTVA